MTGDAALVRTFHNAAGEHHALRIGVEGAISFVLDPEPVAIVLVITRFTLEHHGHGLEELFAILGNRVNAHSVATVVALHDNLALLAAE